MNVKIKPANKFNLTINGVDFGEFRCTGQLDCVASYAGQKGQVIAMRMDAASPLDLLGFLNLEEGNEIAGEWVVIKASPSILAEAEKHKAQ